MSSDEHHCESGVSFPERSCPAPILDNLFPRGGEYVYVVPLSKVIPLSKGSKTPRNRFFPNSTSWKEAPFPAITNTRVTTLPRNSFLNGQCHLQRIGRARTMIKCLFFSEDRQFPFHRLVLSDRPQDVEGPPPLFQDFSTVCSPCKDVPPPPNTLFFFFRGRRPLRAYVRLMSRCAECRPLRNARDWA